jgi:hypothetical protein
MKCAPMMASARKLTTSNKHLQMFKDIACPQVSEIDVANTDEVQIFADINIMPFLNMACLLQYTC